MTAWVSKGAGKFPLESVVPSDVVGRVFSGGRGVSEDISSLISDLVDKGRSTTAFLSEVVAPSDLASRVFNAFRTTSESPAISDAVVRVFGGFRALAETQTIADVVARVFGGFRTLTESPTVADSVDRVFAGARGVSEDLSSLISDLVDHSMNTAAFLSEVVAPSDLASRVFIAFMIIRGASRRGEAVMAVVAGL